MILHGAFSILRRDMLVVWRDFITELLAVVAYPLTFYLAFGIGMRGYIADVAGLPYPVFIAPGLISMTAVNAAFDDSSWSMWFHRRVQKTIEEYRITPITTYDIVIGKIFSGFCLGAVKSLAVAAVIFVLAPFHVTIPHLLGYLFFLALGSMIFSCLGTICGTVTDKPANIGRVQAVLILPLIFMSGVFFPLSSYPPAVLPFIRLLPTTAIFEGARQMLMHGSFSLSFAVILATTAAVAFIVAVYIFNRRIEE